MAFATLLAAAGSAHAGSVVCAGTGPLGDGTTASSNVPVRVMNLADVVSLGVMPMMVVKSDGTVWTWGDGTDEPRQLAGLDHVVAVQGAEISHIAKLALKADGTVWQWSDEEPVPVPVPDPADATGTLTRVTAIASGARTHYALKSDGTVWAWGQNYYNDQIYGLIGDGTTIDRPTPVQCLNLADIKAIAADRSHAMALGADGTVWGWGGNTVGQLGDGTYTAQVAPVPVFPRGGSPSPGARAVGIAASASTSYVLRADGTVWACGENTEGELGDGTTVSKGDWVRVGDLTGVASIVSGPNVWAAIALKSDGSAWGWGLNDHGLLGCAADDIVLLPCRVRGVAAEGSRYLGGVTGAASDVDKACFLTTQEPVHVASIAMTGDTGVTRVATVTVLGRLASPVRGAAVSGHWSCQSAPRSVAVSGATGADGTVSLSFIVIQRPGETCTFTLDDVTKPDTFLDRANSVLSNSLVVRP